jgi:chromate transporter
MTKAALWPLLGAFAPLSLMMFGGANSIIPEIHRQAVEVHGWMNDSEFATLFAVAQAAPGPNILVVSLIGWQVAGLAGLLVATLAINVPHCALTYLVGSMIRRAKDAAWLHTLKEALVPITTGLILASGFVMGRAADHGPLSAIISAIAAGFVIFTDRNPLWMLAAASCAGLLGYHHEWLV